LINIQAELATVKNNILSFDWNSLVRIEIVLDEKSATNIEIAEDALGDEVYYNYLKIGRKLIDENVLNEERV
jgi:hypothetical protein